MKFCKKNSVHVLSKTIFFKSVITFSLSEFNSFLNSSVSNSSFSIPARAIDIYSDFCPSVIFGYFILIPTVLILLPSGKTSLIILKEEYIYLCLCS